MAMAVRRHMAAVAAIAVVVCSAAAQAGETSPLVRLGADGKLAYAPDPRGNAILDYSYAGYGGGGVSLPDVPVKVTLKPDPQSKDDSPRIQAAIDEVSKMPADAKGFRGAVLLERGTYPLASPLTISAGGVVLRGAGSGADGTVLRAIMREKCILISVTGEGDRKEQSGTRRTITDARVPAGGKTITLESVDGLTVGDAVMVVRNTNEKWVAAVGMDKIPGRPGQESTTKMWKPGPREQYDRTITAISGKQVTLDAPLYNDFTQDYGGGHLFKYAFPGRIAQVGIEGIRAESQWVKGQGPDDRSGAKTIDDLKHADHFIVIDKAEHCWVKNVACYDFLQGGVWVQRNARNVTVQDAHYEVADPKLMVYQDEPHGQTSRYSFAMSGQGNLVLRCTGTFGRHTFMTQSQVAGPNVFLDCDATNQHSVSETHHRWATGVLFDCIGRKSPTSLMSANRAWMGSGHGWSGAYVTMWNCVGNPIICEVPPTASNWAVGCAGERKNGPFNKAIDEPAYHGWGQPVEPVSLYRAQLRDRLGAAALQAVDPQPVAAR
ncbi:MAG: hypothetical protein WBD40_24755 [Tepidisphaeraceae bacterium]